MFAAAILVLHTLTAPALSYARDAQNEYLGTADGLWRLAPLERIAFPGQSIHSLAVHDGKLYVGKQPTIKETSDDHTLVVSPDHGATFTPLDAALRDCSVECGYMAVRQIAFDGDRMFVNACENILVSSDLGSTWTTLYPDPGRPAVQVCPVRFAAIGMTMVVGGECPLDNGWIGSGRLAPDRMAWDAEPQPLNIDGMENRNVQFVERIGAAIYAGVEGGLLRSDDGGASFGWALRYPLPADRYPYIRQIARANDLLVAGGFDKRAYRGYLIASPDEGRTWRDFSALAGSAQTVTLLAVDRDGRILVGTNEGDRHLLGELQPGELPPQGRRRATQH